MSIGWHVLIALFVAWPVAAGPSTSYPNATEAKRRSPPAWAPITPRGEPSPSAGCFATGTTEEKDVGDGHEDWQGWDSIMVFDFVPVTRRFWSAVPRGVGRQGAAPSPLLLAFHGQYGDAEGMANDHNFLQLGKDLGFLTVFPQGIDDSVPIVGQDEGTGWNVGTAGDDSVCAPDLLSPGSVGCYWSCRLQDKCGECNWASCYDERLFVRTLLELLSGRYCLDLSRVYLTGESNGAMAVHYLAQEMVGTFAAVMPWYGLPLLGYGLGANYQPLRQLASARQMAMLQLHGRYDVTIPHDGGVGAGSIPGWIYEPLDRVQKGWAAIHGCAVEATRIYTPWDGGQTRFRCFEHVECASGRRVMNCLYDGYHGDWPDGDTGDEVTVWFMLQSRLSSTDKVEGILSNKTSEHLV